MEYSTYSIVEASPDGTETFLGSCYRILDEAIDTLEWWRRISKQMHLGGKFYLTRVLCSASSGRVISRKILDY